MTLDEALATEGELVAAWDYEDPDRARVRLCAVGEAGASAITEITVPSETREDTIEMLVARGARIGAAYAGTTFVWVVDESGYSVWSADALVSMSSEHPSGVVAVQVFADADDRGHREVRFVLATGDERLVAEQHDPAAHLDITYGADNLSDDNMWAKTLGEQLAIWLLVPLRDDVTGDAIEPDLKIARVARAVAAEAERLPPSGVFEALVRSVGPIGRSSELALRFAPSPLDPETRCVELQVGSPRGTTVSRRSIKQGSNAQIAAFLRRVTTPATCLFTMNELLRVQRQEGSR